MPILILEGLVSGLSWLTTTFAGNTIIFAGASGYIANSLGDNAEKIGKGFKDSGLSIVIPIVGAIFAYNYIVKNTKK